MTFERRLYNLGFTEKEVQSILKETKLWIQTKKHCNNERDYRKFIENEFADDLQNELLVVDEQLSIKEQKQ